MNKSLIPVILTFSNLCLGIISIILCFNGKILTAALCILASAVIDRYDGMAAHKFNAVNPLGKELDSLSDMVSFGVASSCIAWKLSLSGSILGYIPVLIFTICGAYRLARYNISDFKGTYTGMPITITGFLLCLDSIAVIKLGTHTLITVVFMLLLSYLMVSKIQVKKL